MNIFRAYFAPEVLRCTLLYFCHIAGNEKNNKFLSNFCTGNVAKISGAVQNQDNQLPTTVLGSVFTTVSFLKISQVEAVGVHLSEGLEI